MKIQPLGSTRPQGVTNHPQAGFGFALAQATAKQLRFSAHAQTRLQERGIKLSANQLRALNTAVAQAKAKGAKETLVLVDQLAFVVSVTNGTVITLANRRDLKEQIFTNIDSAVIMDGVDRQEPHRPLTD